MNTFKNQRGFTAVLVFIALAIGNTAAHAVEQLVNGNLESSVAPPGWSLEQTVTGLPGAGVNASEQISFANNPPGIAGELGMFLRPFAGNQGTYADQNQMINFILSQSVTAVAGRTYTFMGDSYFAGDADPATNDGFSGGVEFLDPVSPSDPGGTGTVPSPTTTTFELAFLNNSNMVVGTPLTLDLRADGQMNDSTWRTSTPLVSAVPTGATRARVTVSVLNMVENNGFQDAYLDNFSLTDDVLPAANRLTNGNLNEVGPPNGYNLVESPAGTDTASFRDFANHTPGGEQGLWLRAFENGDAELSQTVPATPGGSYTFSAWSRWELNYSGGVPGTTTETSMELAFLDASNAVIGSPLVLDLTSAGQVADNEWRQFSLMGTAPANTANVRVSAGATGMFFNVDPGQSAFFDDFSLDLAVVGVPGDYNENGTVDAADFVVWRDNPASLPNEGASPGVVDQEDYNFWRSRFGSTSGSSSLAAAAAVPEPTGLCLVIVALLNGAVLGRRQLPNNA
jgi:hypothetical protein